MSRIGSKGSSPAYSRTSDTTSSSSLGSSPPGTSGALVAVGGGGGGGGGVGVGGGAGGGSSEEDDQRSDQNRVPLKTILHEFLTHVETLETKKTEGFCPYEKEFQVLTLTTNNLI